jgi:DnaJ-class molecular chaperone
VAVLILAAIVCGAGYYISLKVWPETSCKRCDGSGRNAGSTAKRFGQCRRCDGTGRKPRAGTRMLERRGR